MSPLGLAKSPQAVGLSFNRTIFKPDSPPAEAVTCAQHPTVEGSHLRQHEAEWHIHFIPSSNMPRRRRRPSMLQLQYRFVFEAVRWWLLDFVAFLVATAVHEIPCIAVSSLAKVQCEPAFPLAYAVWPVLVIVGVAVGAWWYYRDYHCGDMYRDFYD